MGNTSSKVSQFDLNKELNQYFGQDHNNIKFLIQDYYSDDVKDGNYTIQKYKNNNVDGVDMAILNENWQKIFSKAHFIYDHTTHYSHPIIDMKLDPSTTIVGYKTACCKVFGQTNYYVVVLLTLHMKSSSYFSTSENYSLKEYDKLQNGNKYCTNKCVVESVQFLGPSNQTLKCYNGFIAGRCQIISNFSDMFQYELGHEITETQFGYEGSGCIQGIHFFLDRKTALKWSNRTISTDAPMTITNKVYGHMLIDEI